MSSSTQPITIHGPFWEAEAIVLGGDFPPGQPKASTYYLRTLFVESNPRQAFGLNQAHLPGTLLALVQVTHVRVAPNPAVTGEWKLPESPPLVQTEEQIAHAIGNKTASLLLLQARPDDLASGPHDFICVGGEIALDTPLALDPFWSTCGVDKADHCRFHGSGASVHGEITIPWASNRLAAWCMLSVDLPRPVNRANDIFRLVVEHERMNVTELGNLRKVWQDLTRYINPRHPRNRPTSDTVQTPTWVTFELADPQPAPNLFWKLENWASGKPSRTLNFDVAEIGVLLADQQPYPETYELAPTALAHVFASSARVEQPAGDTLKIFLTAGDASLPPDEKLVYTWKRGQQEQLHCEDLLVAFDPVQTADYLRRIQNLPMPISPSLDRLFPLGLDFASDLDKGRVSPRLQEEFASHDQPLTSLSIVVEPNKQGWTVGAVTRKYFIQRGGSTLSVFRVDPPLEPAVIWGFVPLEDGWAQLPFPNVTEQVYIDRNLVQQAEFDKADRQPILRGAVYFGNDDPAVLAGYCDEQPWNVALVDARSISGSWELKRDGQGYLLDTVSLTIEHPDLYLNGLLWLSTGQATVEDALPDMSRWTSAVRSTPLRTIDQMDDFFPPLVRLRLEGFGFTLRPSIENGCGAADSAEIKMASARLDALTMRFEVDEALFDALTKDRYDPEHPAPAALPTDIFSRLLPLIWRRHPHLPMVQALPLTQNQHVPNHPSASRQLVPFALETSKTGRPLPTADWRFDLGGARVWPRLAGNAVIAAEWIGQEQNGPTFFDLPLVALSLPGLELDPNPGLSGLSLLPDPEFRLSPQLRFDLPYLDQLNALAQLPKPVRSPGETSPLPDQAPPMPPAPLHRETYVDYWRTLAEKASLASADAVDALHRDDHGTAVRYLVEPYAWPVKPDLRLDVYPGEISLANAGDAAAQLLLAKEAALRGIEGDFTPSSNGTLRRFTSRNGGYQVVAGTMAAYREEDGTYRDQRGLLRSASFTAGIALIKTPVTFHKRIGTLEAYELTSVRQPLALEVTGEPWASFWFRDLPFQVTTGRFERELTRSDEARGQDTDINDPDALGRDLNFLAGYQWHMSAVQDSSTQADDRQLKLAGLDFYPLTLEIVTLDDDKVTQVVAVGRLQLPLSRSHELTDLSNAVELTFDDPGDGKLTLSAVRLVDAEKPGVPAQWPLALKDGELTEAPLLTWSKIALGGDGKTLTVSDAVLDFFLFEAPWSIQLEPISFPLKVETPLPPILKELPSDDAAALSPVAFSLLLDLRPRANDAPPDDAASPHQCDLTLRVRLGNRRTEGLGLGQPHPHAAFEALVTFPLIGSGKPRWQAPTLFDDLKLQIDANAEPSDPNPKLIYKQNTLQFNWTQFKPSTGLPADLDLLPGMPLAKSGTEAYAPTPGFAVLRFTTAPGDGTTAPGDGIPTFDLEMSFVEVLLTCQWGEYATDLPLGGQLPISGAGQQLFSSSAGDLVFAYTCSYARQPGHPKPVQQWDETFLLNGFIEIRNLISWPDSLCYDKKEALLELPPARGQSLGHLRHSIRILFNQHAIPPTLPVIGEQQLLFNLAAQPWQFLAVVEHQLAKVEMSDGQVTKTSDQRWTAVQEIRFCPPAQFADWLGQEIVFPSPIHDEHDTLVDLAKNGGFEETFTPLTGLGEVGAGWKTFNNGGSAKFHFGKDDWLPAVAGGRQSQRIEIDTRGFHPAAKDRYAGIYQTISVVKGAQYALRLKGLIRTTDLDPTHDPFRYVVQVGWTFGPNANWQSVAGSDWKDTSWYQYYDIHNPHGFSVFSTQFTAAADQVTIYVRVWKKWAMDEQILVNVDEFALMGPDPARRPVTLSPLGFFAEELRPLIVDEIRASNRRDLLFVEASAPFWLRQNPVARPAITALQYLPNGTQLAALSNPQDYAPNNPDDAATWQLLLMPFLGRLQAAVQDLSGRSTLQADPVMFVRQRLLDKPGDALPPLALALTNRGDEHRATFDVSAFEALVTRTFARLDHNSLRENWLRLQLPFPETPPTAIQSVLAALPNTPARSSRDVALRRLFDSAAVHYPPQAPPTEQQAQQHNETTYLLPPTVVGPLLVWRQASLLLFQGASRPRENHGKRYGWHLVGIQVLEFTASATTQLLSYPAATLLPAWNIPAGSMPVTFAVSPYLGLAFRGAPAAERDSELAVVEVEIVELLAVDATLNLLRPVSSVLYAERNGGRSPDQRRDEINSWALEMHRRLTPESPIALLRTRQVRRVNVTQANDALVTTQYSYQLVDVPNLGQALARHTLRMRSDVSHLRFRQGQFSPHTMPVGLKGFEIAPSQTTGVQPIYLTTAPERKVAAGNDPNTADTSNATNAPDWPWGLSALRLAVQFTKDQQGISDTIDKLWWQSVQYGVQFRTASSDRRPAASLPSYFRAQAIKSLLPVNVNTPMPVLPANVMESTATSSGQTSTLSDPWQAVMPGRLRYLVTGSRPGVPFVFRHLLLRQRLGVSDAAASLVVSGSVPVQHRAPRPVPLPANRPDGQAFALQPWASHFEPGVNALFTTSPADEAFQASCGNETARRVRIRLISPENGLLTAQWKGDLRFQADWNPELATNERWKLTLTLVGDGKVIELISSQGSDYYEAQGIYSAVARDPSQLQQVSTNIRQFQARIELMKKTDTTEYRNENGYYQVVALPLFYGEDVKVRLPLEPVFVHFEDPEYNRRLASVTAHSVSLLAVTEKSVGGVAGETVAHELRLALDRKAYNPTTEIAFRYDWDDAEAIEKPNASKIELVHVSAAGAASSLKLWLSKGAPTSQTPTHGQIQIESLAAIVANGQDHVPLKPGDRLQVNVFWGEDKNPAISVEADIVEEPVIAAPEAAYALLRWRPDGANADVEAARFAWNPEATRVELVCAEDLRTEVVRRRAVFHWHDAARRSNNVHYAIQKITASGSTHWPQCEVSGRFKSIG